jgi:hypothetical protein
MVVGNIINAPVAAHEIGFFYDKRDDLEALFYVLKTMRTRNLPWKNFNATTDEGIKSIYNMKREISPYELFNDMPIEFA